MVKSPLRVQSQRVLRATATPKGARSAFPSEMLRTPTRRGAAATAALKDSKMKADYRNMSCELIAPEKTVREELGKLRSNGAAGFGVNSASMFERGRFYDEYCAQRLKRKLSVGRYTAPVKDEPKSMVDMTDEDEIVEPAAKEERAPAEDEPKSVARRTDQRVEPAEAKDEPKSVAYSTRRRVESAVKKERDVVMDEPKSVALKAVDRSEHPRYSLRSRNKPPLPVQMNVENSTTTGLGGGRRTRARRN